MSFPPTFTDVWDITQPPDTQQANLLGQDIRNLKNDIMQRMSLLSGTTANRPTPETTNATWGGPGYGLLFFATDTGIVWQWSGSAWVNVTANFFTSTASALATTGSPVIVNTATPPVGSGYCLQSTSATAAAWGLLVNTTTVGANYVQVGQWIVQWGYDNGSGLNVGSSVNVSFPISFTTSVYVVVCPRNSITNSSTAVCLSIFNVPTTSAFTIFNNGDFTTGYYWIAVGY